MLGPAKFGDFSGDDFANHLADLPARRNSRKTWPVSDAETCPRDCKRLTSFMMVSRRLHPTKIGICERQNSAFRETIFHLSTINGTLPFSTSLSLLEDDFHVCSGSIRSYSGSDSDSRLWSIWSCISWIWALCAWTDFLDVYVFPEWIALFQTLLDFFNIPFVVLF